MTSRWTDYRLLFPNPEKSKVVLDIDWRKRIWTPDLFYENSIEGHVQNTIIPNMYLWLFKNKTIQFTARVSIEFSCQMDLRLFPHDTQECDLIIKSLAHTEDELKLLWDENNNITQGEHIVLPQFEIINVTSGECKKNAHFSCLKGSVTMTRRSGYYITNVYVPTCLIVFMSMLSFWIPPDAVPARVTLGVTSLLTIVTKQYQASLPNVSYIVALNIWLSACIGFVFVSLLEYATVIALHTRQKSVSKIKAAAVSEQVKTINKIYPRELRFYRNTITNKKLKKVAFWARILDKITPDNIDYASRVLFPCVFISQCSIYWALYYTP
nr:glutamate-gated chloride channel-like [Parasteatoda tepidariorum]